MDLGASDQAPADRRRFSLAAGAGILGPRLRHRGGRHPRLRLRPRRRRGGPLAAQPRRTDPADRGLWPNQRYGDGRPMCGDQRRTLGPPRDPPGRYARPSPGFFSPQEWFVCSLRLLPREKLLLKSGAEVKFHTGTSEVAAMFYPLRGNQMEGGAAGLIQVRTKTPVVAGPGDHFLLRTPVAGADHRRRPDRRGRAAAVQRAAAPTCAKTSKRGPRRCWTSAASSSTACAGRSRRPSAKSAIAVRAKVPAGRLQEILADLAGRQIIFPVAGKTIRSSGYGGRGQQQILTVVGDFHRQWPESPGHSAGSTAPVGPDRKGGRR